MLKRYFKINIIIEQKEDKLNFLNNKTKIFKNKEEIEDSRNEENENFTFNKDSYFKFSKLSEGLYISIKIIYKALFFMNLVVSIELKLKVMTIVCLEQFLSLFRE